MSTVDSTLTSLLFIGAGAVGLWRGWRDLAGARASVAWPRTSGRVVSSVRHLVSRDEDGDPIHRAAVAYDYEVAGRPYRGDRVCFGDGVALRFDAPQRRRLAAYPTGRAVQVAYDPARPDRAVLEPGARGAAYLACLVPGALTLLGLVGLVGLAR